MMGLFGFGCSFNGVPAEERLHWRSFLVKLGVDNLRGVKNEELLVANHKYVMIFIIIFTFLVNMPSCGYSSVVSYYLTLHQN